MVKLFKLLIKFGKYPIRIDTDEAVTRRNNRDFFEIIKYLVDILEFNTMYPETRKILEEKRREAKKLIGGLFGGHKE